MAWPQEAAGRGCQTSDSKPIAKTESNGLVKDWISDMKERQEPKVTPEAGSSGNQPAVRLCSGCR